MSIAEEAARSASVENFSAFAYRVVQAAVLDKRRRAVRANNGAAMRCLAEVTRRRVDASLDLLSLALSYLSEVQYRALKLRYQDGLSQSDISGVLGVSQPTVSRALQSAKKYFLSGVRR